MLKVYHNQNFLNRQLDTSNLSGDRCVFAAEVHTDDLEEGFMLTNSIYDSWTLNEKVRPSYKSRRSTSVGDLLVRGSKTFVVESCGFRELRPDEVDALSFIEE